LHFIINTLKTEEGASAEAAKPLPAKERQTPPLLHLPTTDFAAPGDTEINADSGHPNPDADGVV